MGSACTTGASKAGPPGPRRQAAAARRRHRLGLAAALLGELILTGHLDVRQGRVTVRASAAPEDALAHTVLDHLIGEPIDHPVRTWLSFLARTAHADVALRLRRAGHVREQMSRHRFRRTVRYVPTDK